MEQKKPVKLSKSILDMKFMKKSKERVEKENDDAEGQAMYASEITAEMRSSGNIIFIETNISNCKDLIEGRLSFGGMNPEIEKYAGNDYCRKIEEVDRCKEKDINDAELAKNYSTVVETVKNKFQDKRSKGNKKHK